MLWPKKIQVIRFGHGSQHIDDVPGALGAHRVCHKALL